jgi:hypothetical protein
MSAIKFVPIERDKATDVLVLLSEISKSGPSLGAWQRERAQALSVVVGEAISIAGEHVSAAELLCAELLELIGRVSGRSLSTIPGPNSLAAAEEALSEMGPVLGKVLHLPRAANTDAKALDAAIARGLADMPGPISMRPFVELKQRPRQAAYDELSTVDVWVVPRKDELWCGHIVRSVEYDSPTSVRLILAAAPPGEDEPF